MSDQEFTKELTAEIVSAYVAKNPVAANQIAPLIQSVFSCLDALDGAELSVVESPSEPAVSIKKSLRADHLICLDCGRKFKSIKRHIGTSHGMTPGEYRSKWNLKSDYPMVAPAYAEARSKIALDLGLGRKNQE